MRLKVACVSILIYSLLSDPRSKRLQEAGFLSPATASKKMAAAVRCDSKTAALTAALQDSSI